tara:strand:+ start:82691 stop:82984 length:294 start_codon:yes stop_codon:yes gene_type:complete
MEKKIGIVYSPGYGAGWSSWGNEEMALDQTLAVMIESGADHDELESYCEGRWPDEYLGGLEDCRVCWVEAGTLFKIREYDGYESIEFNTDGYWIVAK